MRRYSTKPSLQPQKSGHVTLQYPWMNPLLKSMPECFKAQPLWFIGGVIADIVEGRIQHHNGTEYPTIFHILLRSNLPAKENSTERLLDETQIIFATGFIITA